MAALVILAVDTMVVSIVLATKVTILAIWAGRIGSRALNIKLSSRLFFLFLHKTFRLNVLLLMHNEICRFHFFLAHVCVYR